MFKYIKRSFDKLKLVLLSNGRSRHFHISFNNITNVHSSKQHRTEKMESYILWSLPPKKYHRDGKIPINLAPANWHKNRSPRLSFSTCWISQMLPSTSSPSQNHFSFIPLTVLLSFLSWFITFDVFS